LVNLVTYINDVVPIAAIFFAVGFHWSLEVSWCWRSEEVEYGCVMLVCLLCVCLIRLCDLHKSVNQLRPPSSSTSEDDHLLNDPVAWAEAKGGKKGDVLKLVSHQYMRCSTVIFNSSVGSCSSLYGIRPSYCQLSTSDSTTLP